MSLRCIATTGPGQPERCSVLVLQGDGDRAGGDRRDLDRSGRPLEAAALLLLHGPHDQAPLLLAVTGAAARDWEDMASFSVNGRGVLLVEPTEAFLLSYANTREKPGLYVAEVPARSSLRRSGLKPDSIIVRVDGKRVRTLEDFKRCEKEASNRMKFEFDDVFAAFAAGGAKYGTADPAIFRGSIGRDQQGSPSKSYA